MGPPGWHNRRRGLSFRSTFASSLFISTLPGTTWAFTASPGGQSLRLYQINYLSRAARLVPGWVAIAEHGNLSEQGLACGTHRGVHPICYLSRGGVPLGARSLEGHERPL